MIADGLEISTDRWIGIVGAAIGIVGIVVALYSGYRFARSRGEPTYKLQKRRIIGPSGSSSESSALLGRRLKLYFDQHEIDAANSAYIAVWNTGKTTIDEALIIADDPLRLELDDNARFLGEPSILAQTRDGMNVECHQFADLPNRIDLKFEFMGRREGVLVEVVYSGRKDGINVRGGFKKSRPLKNAGTLTVSHRRLRAEARTVFAVRGIVGTSVVIAFTLALGIVAAIAHIFTGRDFARTVAEMLAWCVIEILLGAAVTLILWLAATSSIPTLQLGHKRVPSGLRVLHDVQLREEERVPFAQQLRQAFLALPKEVRKEFFGSSTS